MKGVDKNDQLASYFRPSIRTRRPTRNYLFHCMQLAAINAHILYKKLRPEEETKTTKEFMQHLALALIRPLIAEHQSSKKKRRESYEHALTTLKKPRYTAESKCIPTEVMKDSDRRRCVVCAGGPAKKKKLVWTYCSSCEDFLCCDKADGSEKCWSTYHSR